MNAKTLGKYLKDLRKSAHLTQEFVASRLDISRQAYSHYETGRVIPPNDMCIRLAEIYGVDANEILRLVLSSSNIDVNVSGENESPEDISDYVDFIESKDNSKRMRFLSMREKRLLYYFNALTLDEQEDILDFLVIKSHRMKE